MSAKRMQATKRSDSIVIVSGWMSGGQRARERRVLQRRGGVAYDALRTLPLALFERPSWE
jgi:hypothetical protein